MTSILQTVLCAPFCRLGFKPIILLDTAGLFLKSVVAFKNHLFNDLCYWVTNFKEVIISTDTTDLGHLLVRTTMWIRQHCYIPPHAHFILIIPIVWYKEYLVSLSTFVCCRANFFKKWQITRVAMKYAASCCHTIFNCICCQVRRLCMFITVQWSSGHLSMLSWLTRGKIPRSNPLVPDICKM